MKKILIATIFALSGCSYLKEKTPDEKLSELKPPIVVISTGSSLSSCMIKVIDSNGTMLSLFDDSACSLKRGDTIKRAIY